MSRAEHLVIEFDMKGTWYWKSVKLLREMATWPLSSLFVTGAYTKQHSIRRTIDAEEEEAGASIYKGTLIYQALPSVAVY